MLNSVASFDVMIVASICISAGLDIRGLGVSLRADHKCQTWHNSMISP